MIRELWSIVCPAGTPLASTVEISSALNRWFRRSNSISENGIWILILMAIGTLWMGLYFWDRWRKPRRLPGLDREGLFTQLCDLHHLSNSDRQLLRTVAKTQRLDQPALAFVNPKMLLAFAESTPQATLEVRHLADRLFGPALIEDIVKQSRA
jgi:hypothetical protein